MCILLFPELEASQFTGAVNKLRVNDAGPRSHFFALFVQKESSV